MGTFSKLLPNDALPKWQVALIVSIPVAFGLGYLYYKLNVGNKSIVINVKKDEEKNKESSKSSSGGPIANHVEMTASRQAESLKMKGNACFKAENFDEAVHYYTEALKICPVEDIQQKSTFYQNRAAAYDRMNDLANVIEDCTSALNLNKYYVKAMLRRAKAAEKQKNYELALEDLATACIVERFQISANVMELDRVAKAMASRCVDDYMVKHVPKLPSQFFIKTYLSTYHHGSALDKLDPNDEIVASLLTKFKAVEELLMASENIEKPCEQLMKECEETGQELIKIETLLLRATYYVLSKQNTKAFADLDEIINKEDIDDRVKVNALIKRGTLYQHQTNVEKREQDFNKAIEIDENNPDIYHHLGQIYLITENMSESVNNFRKAVALDPNCPVTAVQHCYAEYKFASSERNAENIIHYLNEFKTILKKFPDNIECITLYAQVLTERQEYSEGENLFNAAIQREPKNAALLVHKALLILQWKADVEKAKTLINEALELDSDCEFAYETIATIEMQLGNTPKAVEYFDEAIKRFTSVEELYHLFCLRNTSVAQVKAEKRVGRLEMPPGFPGML